MRHSLALLPCGSWFSPCSPRACVWPSLDQEAAVFKDVVQQLGSFSYDSRPDLVLTGGNLIPLLVP